MRDILKEKFNNKKILILGLGREGLSTYRFLRNLDFDTAIHLADRKNLSELDNSFIEILKDDNVKVNCGLNYLDNLASYDIIIKTPGIPRKLKEIEAAMFDGVQFTSQTQIFLESYSNKIIGVTGTKGKSTTSSLIYHILKNSGIKCELLGNIGKPVLDYFEIADKMDYLVFEMSSHQLFDVTLSPHVAVFLNIFPEHLDYYKSYEEYFGAKANITLYQKADNILVYNGKSEEISNIAGRSKAKKLDFSKVSLPKTERKLIGKHNLENVKAAFVVAKEVGVAEDKVVKAIASFEPLEGRLETVGNREGVAFVNDTLATIPEATMEAVGAFADKNITLILGGFDRGLDFSWLAKELKKSKQVKTIILIGQTAPRIKFQLEKHGFEGKLVDLGSSQMAEVVKLAYDESAPNSVVLLSPASTSFDMFKDYKDRGDQFKKAVTELTND